MTEKVLDYARKAFGDYDGGVLQTRPWDCGPASAQIILQAAGVVKSEQWIINAANAGLSAADKIDTDGTNHAGLLCPILNELLPGSGYTEVWLTKEPVSQKDIDTLWKNVTRSLDGNRGVLLNFEVPPWATIRTSKGSVAPPYSTTVTTFHYVAGMGYAVDPDGSRHIWIADPAGFGGITGYWIPIAECARLIVPHAYAFAAKAPIVVVNPPVPVPSPPPTDPLAVLTTRVDRQWNEWNAFQFSDLDAIGVLVTAAKNGDTRAQRALARLEEVNPAALAAFVNRKAVA